MCRVVRIYVPVSLRRLCDYRNTFPSFCDSSLSALILGLALLAVLTVNLSLCVSAVQLLLRETTTKREVACFTSHNMEILSYLAGIALLLQPVISSPVALPNDEPSADSFNPDSDINSNVNCASGVQIIAARGTSEDAGMGAMASLANDIMDKIPNSRAIGLRYPARERPSYSDSEETGVDHMRNYIQYFNQHCPKTKLVLLGYSQVSLLMSMNTNGKLQG